jgi:two-component system, OmpR family, response regulator
MSRVNAYLVEDSAVITENLIAALGELADVNVVGSSGAESEAKTWLRQIDNDWQLAIVDIFLREGSGFEVLAACRQRKPEQKMVVLSNYATPEIRTHCLQLGADAVFDKSTEIDDLIDFCLSLHTRGG